MTYMIVIVSLLLVVGVSYIVIVWHTHKISKKAQQNANNQVRLSMKMKYSENTVKCLYRPINHIQQVNNNIKALGAKVLLVIGSQLLCWITVMVLMIMYGMWTNKVRGDVLSLQSAWFIPSSMGAFLFIF